MRVIKVYLVGFALVVLNKISIGCADTLYEAPKAYSIEKQEDLRESFALVERWIHEELPDEKKFDLSYVLDRLERHLRSLVETNLLKTTKNFVFKIFCGEGDDCKFNNAASRLLQLHLKSDSSDKKTLCPHWVLEALGDIYYGVFAPIGGTLQILQVLLRDPLSEFVQICHKDSYEDRLVVVENYSIKPEMKEILREAWAKDPKEYGPMLEGYSDSTSVKTWVHEHLLDRLMKLDDPMRRFKDIDQGCKHELDLHSKLFELHSVIAKLAGVDANVFLSEKSAYYWIKLYRFKYCRVIVEDSQQILDEIRERKQKNLESMI